MSFGQNGSVQNRLLVNQRFVDKENVCINSQDPYNSAKLKVYANDFCDKLHIAVVGAKFHCLHLQPANKDLHTSTRVKQPPGGASTSLW